MWQHYIFIVRFRISQAIWKDIIFYCEIPNMLTCHLFSTGRDKRICQTNKFKVLTIRSFDVPYLFRNSIRGNKYRILPHALPYAACVKEYVKNMLTPKIGSPLGCHLNSHSSRVSWFSDNSTFGQHVFTPDGRLLAMMP